MDTKVEGTDNARITGAAAAVVAQTVCEAIDQRIAAHNREITHLMALRDSLPLSMLGWPAFQLRHLSQRL